MKTATSQAGQGHGAPKLPEHPFEIYAERMKSAYEARDFALNVMEPAFWDKKEYRWPMIGLRMCAQDHIEQLAREAQQVGALLLCGVRS